MARERHSISPEGLAEAEAELRHRREVKRVAIVAAIKAAREDGDLKENAEYHAAREEQGLNESRIRVLEHHLATVKVREGSAGDSVAVGSRVSYRDGASDDVIEVTVVHPLESNVAEGKISVESPIAKALLGAHEGERVDLETARGPKQLEVLEVA